MTSRTTPFTYSVVILALLIGILLVPTARAQDATPPGFIGSDPDAACAAGRLRIRDLERAQATLTKGLESNLKEAQGWQRDSRLYALRLTCPIFTAGLKWEAEYFSPTAQSMYATDTGKITPVEQEAKDVPTLDMAQFDLTLVYRSLTRAGFADDALLSASGGMTIRPSTEILPFGPKSAPRGQTYAHLAIEVSGQITDVWVSLQDGVIYRYSSG